VPTNATAGRPVATTDDVLRVVGNAGPASARPLGAVVAESMGNWLGHDNIIEQNIEIEAAEGAGGGE